jgi:hypothetical protein
VTVVERLKRIIWDLPETTVLVVLHGLDDASLIVHHEWAIGDHGFLDWLPAEQEDL